MRQASLGEARGLQREIQTSHWNQKLGIIQQYVTISLANTHECEIVVGVCGPAVISPVDVLKAG